MPRAGGKLKILEISLAHRLLGPSKQVSPEGQARMGPNADRKTLDRLVLEHLPSALKFAVRLTGSADAAEDVVQDALVRVARHWQTYRAEAQFRTWLFRIVIHAFRDRVCRRPAPAELPERLVDDRTVDPAARAIEVEQGQLVAQAVSALPARQREVIVLHTYQQMTTAEIAELLHLTEPNVRAQLSYARARLKQVLVRHPMESRER